ncbi:MAG: hypothetical protein K2N92_00935 [Malacoplasma sp.]|nr:hypothetical protein [Malacoplasma sp.]MDE6082380.1 hypothetical protein [Malacoplasma sp.]MDE6429030.1 hypothetical protein [Malacoplasma sp.]MDE7112143.1 hypothetical protein [Malacoplasma sp.]
MNKKNKILLSLSFISLSIAAPIILTSCSSQNSKQEKEEYQIADIIQNYSNYTITQESDGKKTLNFIADTSSTIDASNWDIEEIKNFLLPTSETFNPLWNKFHYKDYNFESFSYYSDYFNNASLFKQFIEAKNDSNISISWKNSNKDLDSAKINYESINPIKISTNENNEQTTNPKDEKEFIPVMGKLSISKITTIESNYFIIKLTFMLSTDSNYDWKWNSNFDILSFTFSTL